MAAPGAPGPDFGSAQPILRVSCACAVVTSSAASAADPNSLIKFMYRPPSDRPFAARLFFQGARTLGAAAGRVKANCNMSHRSAAHPQASVSRKNPTALRGREMKCRRVEGPCPGEARVGPLGEIHVALGERGLTVACAARWVLRGER